MPEFCINSDKIKQILKSDQLLLKSKTLTNILYTIGDLVVIKANIKPLSIEHIIDVIKQQRKKLSINV